MIGIHEALDALDGTALPSGIDICRVALCSYLGFRELKDEDFHYRLNSGLTIYQEPQELSKCIW
jgi:hypothetical protein